MTCFPLACRTIRRRRLTATSVLALCFAAVEDAGWTNQLLWAKQEQGHGLHAAGEAASSVFHVSLYTSRLARSLLVKQTWRGCMLQDFAANRWDLPCELLSLMFVSSSGVIEAIRVCQQRGSSSPCPLPTNPKRRVCCVSSCRHQLLCRQHRCRALTA